MGVFAAEACFWDYDHFKHRSVLTAARLQSFSIPIPFRSRATASGAASASRAETGHGPGHMRCFAPLASGEKTEKRGGGEITAEGPFQRKKKFIQISESYFQAYALVPHFGKLSNTFRNLGGVPKDNRKPGGAGDSSSKAKGIGSGN